MKYRFTNRNGGSSTGVFASLNVGTHVSDDYSTVLSNRALLAQELGPIQYMSQVHGNRVAVIEHVTDEDPTADALVTGIPGISLAVQVADCIPLLLHSPESVAAVHIGRKGLLNDVTTVTLEVMRKIGSSQISAIIGPAICGKCYEVSQEIHDEVVAIHPSARSLTPKGTPALDLVAALKKILDNEGVSYTDQSRCTVENSDLFSYRRDSVTGRQAGIISL
jgi:YfiH family protein